MLFGSRKRFHIKIVPNVHLNAQMIGRKTDEHFKRKVFTRVVLVKGNV